MYLQAEEGATTSLQGIPRRRPALRRRREQAQDPCDALATLLRSSATLTPQSSLQSQQVQPRVLTQTFELLTGGCHTPQQMERAAHLARRRLIPLVRRALRGQPLSRCGSAGYSSSVGSLGIAAGALLLRPPSPPLAPAPRPTKLDLREGLNEA
jgi:hypothetical protein